MAKYTMLLAEYLERGGQLPASFSLINGFTDLFKKHYCDKEIGFETELLFFMKLDEKADLYMQAYADKIQRLATAWNVFDAPVKTRYVVDDRTFNAGARKETFGGGARKETLSAGARKETLSAGAQHAETTELPFDSQNAEPNVLSDTDAYENVTDNDAYEDVKDNDAYTDTRDNDAYKDTEKKETTIEESGEDHDEAVRSIEFLNSKVYSLLNELLLVFKPCFMGVY